MNLIKDNKLIFDYVNNVENHYTISRIFCLGNAKQADVLCAHKIIMYMYTAPLRHSS